MQVGGLSVMSTNFKSSKSLLSMIYYSIAMTAAGTNKSLESHLICFNFEKDSTEKTLKKINTLPHINVATLPLVITCCVVFKSI